MGKTIKFYEMEAGNTYRTAVMVTGMKDKFTRSGDPYVALDIFDGQKTIKTNLWRNTISSLESAGVTKGAIVHFSFSVISKDGGNGFFYNIDEKDWTINTDSNITVADFVHKAPHNPDQMFNWILEQVIKVDSNPEKSQMLEHMLASHHGKLEWGAITTPAFPEAEMLHLIDMIDSRMNMFEEAYKGQSAGSISDEKVFGLENSYIYKPLYPTV